MSGNGIKRCLSFLDTILGWYFIAKTTHVNTRSVPSWSNHPGSFSFSHPKVSRFGNRFPFRVAVISVDQPIAALEGWDKASIFPFKRGTLQGINISHLGKRKIIFKMPFWGDMFVPWRVYINFWSTSWRIIPWWSSSRPGVLGSRTQMAKNHGFQMGVILTTYHRHGMILQVVFQNSWNEWALELLSRPELFDSIWES